MHKPFLANLAAPDIFSIGGFPKELETAGLGHNRIDVASPATAAFYPKHVFEVLSRAV